MEKRVLTTFEAARLCSVSYNTIKNWIKRDLLKAYRTAGGHLRIEEENLRRFCQQQGIPALEEKGNRRWAVIYAPERSMQQVEKALTASRAELSVHVVSCPFEAGRLVERVMPELIVLGCLDDALFHERICESVRGHDRTSHAKIISISKNGKKDGY